MSRRSSFPRRRGRARRLAAAWLGLALPWAGAAPAGAAAATQEAVPRAARTPAPRPPGRAVLGVRLRERCPHASREAPCPEPPLVWAVEAGGPADQAGVQPGDTLLSLDGRPLTSASGRRALASLEAGRAVRVGVGRPGEGRRALTVVPRVLEGPRTTMRFRIVAPGRDRLWVLADEERTRARDVDVEVEVVEIPAFAERLAEVAALQGRSLAEMEALQAAAESLRTRVHTLQTDSERLRVYFVPDGEGMVRVRVGGPEAAAPQPPGAFVWEHPRLARELEMVRDSVGRLVRLLIDSLRRLSAVVGAAPHPVPGRVLRPETAEEVVEAAREAEQALAELRVRERAWARAPWGAAPPAALEPLFSRDRRAAGAEFAPLTPGLAEHFPGVRGGLLVLRVLPGTPAARAGLRDGDVVVEVDGRRTDSVDALRELLVRAATEDRPPEVKWVRKGHAMTGRLPLGL